MTSMPERRLPNTTAPKYVTGWRKFIFSVYYKYPPVYDTPFSMS